MCPSVHLSIWWIPLSASKASFESGSRVKTVLSGTATIQGHQPVALAPGSVGIVVGYGQHRVKLPPRGSPGQGIFAWILHWNLKSTATRKHLFSCPSMIKQVAPRHKEAEFPLGELFSFCCKISNILTFPSDFSLYQSCNGRTISRHLDFRGLLVSEHSLLYKGTLLKGRVISVSETKGKVTKTRAL